MIIEIGGFAVRFRRDTKSLLNSCYKATLAGDIRISIGAPLVGSAPWVSTAEMAGTSGHSDGSDIEEAVLLSLAALRKKLAHKIVDDQASARRARKELALCEADIKAATAARALIKKNWKLR